MNVQSEKLLCIADGYGRGGAVVSLSADDAAYLQTLPGCTPAVAAKLAAPVPTITAAGIAAVVEFAAKPKFEPPKPNGDGKPNGDAK